MVSAKKPRPTKVKKEKVVENGKVHKVKAMKKKGIVDKVLKAEPAPKKVKKNKVGEIANAQKVKTMKKKEIAEKIVKTESSQTKENILEKKLKKNVMPSKYITKHIVDSCLTVLKELATKTKKNTIFDEELPVFAEIIPMKIQKNTGNIRIVLPHSTVASTGEICLITKDLKKGKKHDHEPTIDHWQEMLRKAGVTQVKTILPMRQLRVEYDQFEMRRRLLTQHDFIMVDTRVLPHVSHLLGKLFKKTNRLVPVRINEGGDFKKDIDIGIRTTMLRMNEGPTSIVTVGHIGMEQEKLRDNVLAMVEKLKDRFPGGQANIRTITLKLPLSLSLPIYLTLRSSSNIPVPKIKKTKPKLYNEVEDELSTIPGVRVRVAPDGTIQVIRDKTENFDLSDDGDDNEGSEPEVEEPEEEEPEEENNEDE